MVRKMTPNLLIENFLACPIIEDIKRKFNIAITYSEGDLVFFNDYNAIFFVDYIQEDLVDVTLVNWKTTSSTFNLFGIGEHLNAGVNNLQIKNEMSRVENLIKFCDLGMQSEKKRWSFCFALALILIKGNELFSLEVCESNKDYFTFMTSFSLEKRKETINHRIPR